MDLRLLPKTLHDSLLWMNSTLFVKIALGILFLDLLKQTLWVSNGFFIKKYQSNKSIDQLKICFIAKGYTQLPGLDYTDTFSPVVKAFIFYVVLSLAITHGWPLR